MNVIVYTPADEADKKKNRGFCFVDFDTHKNASVARRKLGSGRVRVRLATEGGSMHRSAFVGVQPRHRGRLG